jgi:hypothetical protein
MVQEVEGLGLELNVHPLRDSELLTRGRRPELESKRHGICLVQLHGEASDFRFRKTARLCGHGVRSHSEINEQEFSLSIRGKRPRKTGAHIRDGDVRIGKHRPSLVGHIAGDVPADNLRASDRCGRPGQQREQKNGVIQSK